MRKRKIRGVCALPKNSVFFPGEKNQENNAVVLTLDEYEVIRLVDYERLSQEESGELMSVSRATAQRIHRSARNKIATALVEGRTLRIEGGEYQLDKE